MRRRMRWFYFLLPFFLFAGMGEGWAQQWTRQDSLWLRGVLEGKDSLRLDPELMERIRSGELLDEPEPMGAPRSASPEIPIEKDFSEYIQGNDNPSRKVPLRELPPSVFWWHTLPLNALLPIEESVRQELRARPGASPGNVTFDMARMTSREEYIHRRNARRNETRENYDRLPDQRSLRFQRQLALRKAQAAHQDSTRSKFFVGPLPDEGY